MNVLACAFLFGWLVGFCTFVVWLIVTYFIFQWLKTSNKTDF